MSPGSTRAGSLQPQLERLERREVAQSEVGGSGRKPPLDRIVGGCVGPDRFTPAMAINKEIDLRFVLAYTPLEYRDTLHMLAEGKLDPRPLITGITTSVKSKSILSDWRNISSAAEPSRANMVW